MRLPPREVTVVLALLLVPAVLGPLAEAGHDSPCLREQPEPKSDPCWYGGYVWVYDLKGTNETLQHTSAGWTNVSLGPGRTGPAYTLILRRIVENVTIVRYVVLTKPRLDIAMIVEGRVEVDQVSNDVIRTNTVIRYIPPLKQFDFPLEKGKTWDSRARVELYRTVLTPQGSQTITGNDTIWRRFTIVDDPTTHNVTLNGTLYTNVSTVRNEAINQTTGLPETTQNVEYQTWSWEARKEILAWDVTPIGQEVNRREFLGGLLNALPGAEIEVKNETGYVYDIPNFDGPRGFTFEPFTFRALPSDPDGVITKASWGFREILGRTSIEIADGITFTHRFTKPGTYDLILAVRDDDIPPGLGGNETFIEVWNRYPTVTARGPAVVVPNTEVRLDVSGTDLDGNVTRMHVAWGDGASEVRWRAGVNQTENDTFTHSFATPGLYTVTASVYDDFSNVRPGTRDFVILAEYPRPGADENETEGPAPPRLLVAAPNAYETVPSRFMLEAALVGSDTPIVIEVYHGFDLVARAVGPRVRLPIDLTGRPAGAVELRVRAVDVTATPLYETTVPLFHEPTLPSAVEPGAEPTGPQGTGPAGGNGTNGSGDNVTILPPRERNETGRSGRGGLFGIPGPDLAAAVAVALLVALVRRRRAV